jgi:hypothetical protein
MTKNRILIFLFIGSLFNAVFWNELNKNNLQHDRKELRQNSTVITNDDYSYLNPFDNLINHGSLYANNLEKYTSIIRPPGYGSIYLFCVLLFGKTKSLFFLFLFQCILFSISVILLYQISEIILKSKTLGLIVAIIYGFLPFSISFLNYSLTEGVTPALLIIYVYFLTKGNIHEETKARYYILAAITFSVILIIRPQLGLFIIPLIFLLINDYFSAKDSLTFIKRTLLVFFISFSLFSFWEIRNKIVLGHWTELHPIYQNEIPGLFRLPHQSAWEFFKQWETSGKHFHETLVPFWENTMKLDSSSKNINDFIHRIPNKVLKTIGVNKLVDALQSYQKAIIDQKTYFDSKTIMPSIPLRSEIIASEKFNQLSVSYKSKQILNSYFLTPLKILKSMIFHSNLSLYQFQVSFRGNWVMEFLRFIALIIHSTIYFTLPMAIFFCRKNKLIVSFIIPILMYIFYLTYFQRGIEERYTLVLLPFLILIAFSSFQNIHIRIQHYYKVNI